MVDVMLIVLVIIIIAVVFLVLSSMTQGEQKVVPSLTASVRLYRHFNTSLTPAKRFFSKYKYLGHFKDKPLRTLPIKAGEIKTIDDLIKSFRSMPLPEYVGFQYYSNGKVQVFFGNSDARYSRYGRSDLIPVLMRSGVRFGRSWTNTVYRLKTPTRERTLSNLQAFDLYNLRKYDVNRLDAFKPLIDLEYNKIVGFQTKIDNETATLWDYELAGRILAEMNRLINMYIGLVNALKREVLPEDIDLLKGTSNEGRLDNLFTQTDNTLAYMVTKRNLFSAMREKLPKVKYTSPGGQTKIPKLDGNGGTTTTIGGSSVPDTSGSSVPPASGDSVPDFSVGSSFKWG